MFSTRPGLAAAAARRCLLSPHRTFAVVAALVLASCGGGGGGADGPAPSTPPAATETLFVANNAWTTALPADAATVTTDEFRRQQVAGELHVVTPASQLTLRTAHQQKVAAERDFLESRTDLSAEVAALLLQARTATDFEASPVATLPGGQQVVLIDLDSRIENAAENYRRAHDPANALAAYAFSYSLLNDAVKTQVPAPDTLRGGTLDQIRQATQQLDTALATMPDLDNTRLDPDAPPGAQDAAGAVRALAVKVKPGNGVDNDGPCAPTGLARRFWFPLRAFVSPVKSQASRGTCWAFAAIASVESRERVQNNFPLDLSEQYLVNKVKHEWSPVDYGDGGSSAGALNAAVDRNELLLSEADWTYNPATGRPPNAFDAGVASTAAAYVGTCTGYGPAGSCSETAHESERVCTRALGLDFCGFVNAAPVGSGTRASRVRLLWSSGETFNVNQYRALLASGVSLMASFPVYEGFRAAPATGIVSDYGMQMRDSMNNLVNGTYGGHLVQIVGFISNEQLSFPGAAPSNVGGGGYFIIRNSWGCRTADSGYFYVPADYVSSRFSTLEALDFDARRSTRWNDEQKTPGGTTGLAIDPRGTVGVDLRVAANLASQFAVSHPVANYVRLTVTSNRDGLLFDGQWLVNAPVGGSLFANSLPVNFQTEGLRTLTLTARYGTQVVTVNKDVLVLNAPPEVHFEFNGTPLQNENFVINAIVTDRNEANPAALCNAMTWAVDAPDTLVSGTGCARVVRFGATGAREVRVATQDQEGRQGSAVGTFTVSPPPVNPYPRITTAGLFSRDSRFSGAIFLACVLNQVGNNAQIDLRDIGCSNGLAQPTRYTGQLTIENPAAEVLSYDWTYAVYAPGSTVPAKTLPSHTTTPNYNMGPIVFGFLNTYYNCTLDVRVNAPEASRNKTQRVWSGRCINVEDTPR